MFGQFALISSCFLLEIMTTSRILLKKRVSKKNKSSWRQSDVKDVEEFLEDQRAEERFWGPVEDRNINDVFTIDNDPQEPILSKKELRRLKAKEPAKCYALLQPLTNVQDPIAKRNHVRTKEERMCPIVKKKEAERKLRGILKNKEMQQIKDRQKYEEKKLQEKREKIVDIWENEDKKADDWIENVTRRHTLRWTGKLNKVIPRMKNTLKGVLPNIEYPHPGISYNPSIEDHQKLLQEITEKELKLIKEEDHINRVTTGMFRKVTTLQNQNNWITEMSEGLPKPDEVNKPEQPKSIIRISKPYDTINPPVENKKKTTQQRRKQREQIKLQEERLKAKLEKKKISDIYKLKFIQHKITMNEKLCEKHRQKRLIKKSERNKQSKQLSKLKFSEPELEFNLGEEIAGNLRNVKSEGNLLKDRFQSMQKRNILEVTKRHIRKKSKIKRFDKPGYKDLKKTVAK